MMRTFALTFGARRKLIVGELLGRREERAHRDVVEHDRVHQVFSPRDVALVDVRAIDVDRTERGAEARGDGGGPGGVEEGARQRVLRRVLGHEVATTGEVDLPANAESGRGVERRDLRSQVVDHAVVVHLHVVDRDRAPGDHDRPVVRELSPRFRVEERLLEHDRRSPLPVGDAR